MEESQTLSKQEREAILEGKTKERQKAMVRACCYAMLLCSTTDTTQK